jgi:ribulose-phosphate 3-epimerase
MKKRFFQLSLSLISTNLSDLNKKTFNDLKGVSSLHFDVMDNHFVPRFGLYPELVGEIKKYTNLPIDIHLMVDKPENVISRFIELKPNSITVHVEATNHLHRCLQLIKSCGIKGGTAFNPSTDPATLKYLIDDFDLITIMAINPGIPGHSLIPQTYQKIKDTKRLVGKRKMDILIDGGVNIDTAPRLIKNGANILVCGKSVLYQKQYGNSVANRLNKFRMFLDKIVRK